MTKLSKSQRLRLKEGIEIFGFDSGPSNLLLEWIKNKIAPEEDPHDIVCQLEEEGWIEQRTDGTVQWKRPLNQDKDLYIYHLEEEIRIKKKTISQLLDTVNRFARRLDAMWWVWCDGPCWHGVARYNDEELTEEIVKLAESNTERLRKKWTTLNTKNSK